MQQTLSVQSQQQKYWKRVWNMFKVNIKDIRTTSTMLFWYLLLLTLIIFYVFFLCFIPVIEQINVCWVYVFKAFFRHFKMVCKQITNFTSSRKSDESY